MTPDTPAPPGKATIMRCGSCTGGQSGGRRCSECGGTGRQLWKACPRCGDIGYDRIGPGRYACRLGCGHAWTEDDPGWQAQRMPST
jgi:hypothetical protein